MSRPAVTRDVSSSLSPPLDEDELWQLNLRSTEGMDSGPYPVREGEPDCSYYIRTGLCRFGATCRFNHPPNRNLGAAPSPARGVALLTLTRGASTWTLLEAQPLGPRKAPSFLERDVIDSNGRTLQTHIQAIAIAKMRGEYPERAGQPECQYYLKMGTCKFGAKCKFHHPRDQAGVAGRVSLNVLGYPLRPNESECSYYLRTGQCKFGNTCKFHHPQPSNMMVPFNGSLVYPTVQSPTSPSQQSYLGGITNWSLPSASFVPSPRWQAPSNYAQMILSQGVVSVPGWNAYRGSMGLSSSESQQQPTATNQIYGTLRQNETANEPLTAAYSSYYALPRESVFPERPDQPDCQFYVKTGDCKFGAVCKFHHPRERLIPMPDCVLSPIGLPLRTGETTCIFYSRYGICKFGPSCKFDHPMGIFTYNFSPTSADHHLLASSSGIITSQGPIEGVSVNSRTITLMPSSDNNIDPKE